MKALQITAAAAGLLLSSAAFADTLVITSETHSTNPAAVMSSSAVQSFNPGNKKIIFKALGKTCTLISSGTGGGGSMGCNYTITVNISDETMKMDKVVGPQCTQPTQLMSSCH